MIRELHEEIDKWRAEYMHLGIELGKIINDQQDIILRMQSENRRIKREEDERKKKMSYEQISESTYFQNVEHWNRFAREVRELGGLGICDDETGEELYTI